MMRSLHRSVIRSNKATHKLLKNIEDRKKSTVYRYSMSTSFTSTALDSISESPPSSTHSVHTVAVTAEALHTPFLNVKTRSQIHPCVMGDQNREKEKSTVILDEKNSFNTNYILPNDTTELKTSNVEHSVQTVERNHSKFENGLLERKGEREGEGLEQLPGERQGEEEGCGRFAKQGPGECQRQGQGHGGRQGEGQLQGLEPGEGSEQVFRREIVSEQELGEQWGQGHDQRESEGEKDEEQLSWGEGEVQEEKKQCQLMTASARTASRDLVSDLQDEGDHLVSDLQVEGDHLVSDLQVEGDHLVSDLQDEGDHLVSDLREKGNRLLVAHESNTRLSERSTELT